MSWTEWAEVKGDGLDNFDEIIYEKKIHEELGGGIARISLNKPEKMNTLTLHTVDEMFRAFYVSSVQRSKQDQFVCIKKRTIKLTLIFTN